MFAGIAGQGKGFCPETGEGRGASGPGISVVLVETFVSGGAGALVEKINLQGGKVIGFSLYSWNRALVVQAAEQLRREREGLFLFCGGPEATALPEGLTREQGGPFDAVIPGEGEEATAALLRDFFFGGLSPGVPDRFSSPWLDGTLAVKGRQGVLWELARGCPYNCAYCFESKGERKVRYVPEGRLREELRLFLREGAPYVFVLDPTFNSDNQRALRLLDMIDRETMKAAEARKDGGGQLVHWHFEVRGELLTRAQARRFARLGASLQIGLQSADPETAALAGRVFNRRLFVTGVGFLNQEGVAFGLDLIYGLPGDTLAGYRRSLDFALSLCPDNLDMFRLSVLPGTAFWDKAESLGLEADRKAPYEVFATADFSSADLALAERLSEGTDLFYNRGRAAAWFNQVLRPLRMRPSVFLAEFAGNWGQTFKGEVPGSQEIEEMQISCLELAYARAKKARLLPAVRDIVRYHGAWGRALAEGSATEIEFAYGLGEAAGPQGRDIEFFVKSARLAPSKGCMVPGPEGPKLDPAFKM
jgi:radical SAM superfamily enzyme YgiQ (UPF0313 family)